MFSKALSPKQPCPDVPGLVLPHEGSEGPKQPPAGAHTAENSALSGEMKMGVCEHPKSPMAWEGAFDKGWDPHPQPIPLTPGASSWGWREEGPGELCNVSLCNGSVVSSRTE